MKPPRRQGRPAVAPRRGTLRRTPGSERRGRIDTYDTSRRRADRPDAPTIDLNEPKVNDLRDLSSVLQPLKSLHAARGQHDLHRAQQNGKIQPESPVRHVSEVVPQLVLRARMVVAVDLGKTREAWGEREALGVARHLSEVL